ncbi:MAG: Smr/MutS family protein [Alphaproteobacteria bacterium]|nr:Smr/MutS family protein [Alphaproteobacteria bacterium]
MVKPHKKQLSDKDLERMAGEGFTPIAQRCRGVPRPPRGRMQYAPTTLDLHGHTEEQAWDAIVDLLDNLDNVGAHTCAHKKTVKLKIITGASGILKQKFAQWATESIISPRILSCKLINNGCYEIVARKS